MEGPFITRVDTEQLVERVRESTSREFSSAITTVQVQIGATEKTLSAKIGSLKAWGIAALVGGQVFTGLVTAYVGPHTVVRAGAAVLHALS